MPRTARSRQRHQTPTSRSEPAVGIPRSVGGSESRSPSGHPRSPRCSIAAALRPCCNVASITTQGGAHTRDRKVAHSQLIVMTSAWWSPTRPRHLGQQEHGEDQDPARPDQESDEADGVDAVLLSATPIPAIVTGRRCLRLPSRGTSRRLGIAESHDRHRGREDGQRERAERQEHRGQKVEGLRALRPAGSSPTWRDECDDPLSRRWRTPRWRSRRRGRSPTVGSR